MTISPLALSAKKVIDAAWMNGPSYDLASQAAFALESARLLQSPETASEMRKLRARVVELEAQLDERGRPADEDPIAFVLTEKADDVTPQVRKLQALLAGQRDAVTAEADGITRRIAPTQALRAQIGGDQ